MKKEFTKKLLLNKATIPGLNKKEMGALKGGIVSTLGKGCKTDVYYTALYYDRKITCHCTK